MPRLTHPETGLEFDAPDRSVPTWQRSGWVLKNPPPAPAESSKNGKAAAGTTAEVPKAGD
jgi:hypothetical protein